MKGNGTIISGHWKAGKLNGNVTELEGKPVEANILSNAGIKVRYNDELFRVPFDLVQLVK